MLSSNLSLPVPGVEEVERVIVHTSESPLAPELGGGGDTKRKKKERKSFFSSGVSKQWHCDPHSFHFRLFKSFFSSIHELICTHSECMHAKCQVTKICHPSEKGQLARKRVFYPRSIKHTTNKQMELNIAIDFQFIWNVFMFMLDTSSSYHIQLYGKNEGRIYVSDL